MKVRAQQRSIRGRTPNPTLRSPQRPRLRSTLLDAAIDSATEAATEAAIEAALAPYDKDPEPPMIGFMESINGDPIDCENCIICRMLDAEYGPAERVPLPDGSVLEIRRHRST